MSELQVKINGKYFGLWNCCDERTYAKEPIRNAEIDKLETLLNIVNNIRADFTQEMYEEYISRV